MTVAIEEENTDRSLSAVDVVVQQIKAYIQERGLGPGSQLPSEREIGLMFDASRNTVREAFRTLKAFGVVDVRPKVGAVLVDAKMDAALDLFSFHLTFSREAFRDVQGFRKLIEVGSYDAIAERITPADIVHLRDLNDAMARAETAQGMAEKDFAFHHDLLAIAGNETVVKIYQIMKPMISRLMETGKAIGSNDPTMRTHTQITDALEAGNRLAFQYFMSRHLDDGLAYIPATSARSITPSPTKN
ncbi:MAG: FCD domain-containing protein [Pseudomonadota bacterium]